MTLLMNGSCDLNAFTPGSHMREQPKDPVYELPVESSLWSFESLSPLSQVFSFLSSAFLLSGSAYILLTRWPWDWHLQQKAFSLYCFRLNGPFYQWRSGFLFTCHFLMPLGVNLLFPSPPQRDTFPCSEPWAFLLGRVLKESFSYCACPVCGPVVTPKKGTSCWQCPVSQLISCPHGSTQSLLAQPGSPRGASSMAAVWPRPWRACTALPLRPCLLFSELHSCMYLASQLSKALLFPSGNSVLWSLFAEEKALGK